MPGQWTKGTGGKPKYNILFFLHVRLRMWDFFCTFATETQKQHIIFRSDDTTQKYFVL